MKAVVLAAGKGERLWPLTETRPKPLLPVAGVPILLHTLEALFNSGIDETILVVNYKKEMIKRALEDHDGLRTRVSFVNQSKPLGTAHALTASVEVLKGEDRFAVVYGDNFYDPTAVKRLTDEAKQTTADVVIGSAKVNNTSQFGKLTVKENYVRSIIEKSSNKGPGEIIAGVYIMDDTIFSALKKTRRSARGEYELTEAVQSLIDAGRQVKRIPLKENEWLSISHPWDLLDANRLALDSMEDRREGTVEAGATIRGKLFAANGSIVHSGSYVDGPVYLGPDSTIGPNSYLRPYTTIGARAHIGANCEIKNSILMEASKVPHLSYIGDSIMGEGTSLGAGTITANLRFDEKNVISIVKGKPVDSGRRKLGAILGDNVRTGINVSILPGIKVGQASWLGPGTTISRDIPAASRIRK